MSTASLDLPQPAPAPPTPVAGRSRGAPQSLPIPLTSFVGRDAAAAEITARLLRPDVRLLTLTGPGGVGKTRLALRLAADLAPAFADGVAFVALASVTDPALVGLTIAESLDLREVGDRSPGERLAVHLRDRELLLVLDNFEQVAAAAPLLTDLLVACPKLKVLATSRAPLRLTAEHDVGVPPLGLPDPAGDLTVPQVSESAAVRLLVERAQAARPGFALTESDSRTVAEIVRRLDGLPLAIELAAARLRYLSPSALLARLDQRLPLLTAGPRDAPERQRTLRDAIAWSHDLLDPDLQVHFRRLAVFAGGFTLAAAEYVGRGSEVEGRGNDAVALDPRPSTLDSVLDGITSLVDMSLVRAETLDADEARFAMLETIREYGLEQLAASGEAEEEGLHRAHAAWCLALAERVGPELHGPEQHRWAGELEKEHANLRAALTWLERTDDREAFLRLAATLGDFWRFGGHLREGIGWLERALARAADAPAALRASAFESAGILAHLLVDAERAVALLETSLNLFREVGDQRNAALALYDLGVVAEDNGAYDRAATLLMEAAELTERLGDRRTLAFALLHLGIVAYGRGDPEAAVAESEAGIALAREIESRAGVQLGTFCLALIAAERGERAEAANRYRDMVAWLDAAGTFGASWPRRSIDAVGRTLAGVGALAAAHGQAERSARLFGAAAADREAIGTMLALPERIPFERATAAVRATLGDAAFEAAWATGRAMTPAEARADVEAALAAASGQSADLLSSPSARRAPGTDLTPRELEVLRLLAEGLSDKEIGAALYISPRTAMGHVAKILTKLGVHSRAAAVEVALRRDLV
jgi:predicted ATPase/DNA-binding CsgD family transcriptional regulator